MRSAPFVGMQSAWRPCAVAVLVSVFACDGRALANDVGNGTDVPRQGHPGDGLNAPGLVLEVSPDPVHIPLMGTAGTNTGLRELKVRIKDTPGSPATASQEIRISPANQVTLWKLPNDQSATPTNQITLPFTDTFTKTWKTVGYLRGDSVGQATLKVGQKQVEVDIIKVDINAVVSDQLPGVDVNFLPIGDGTAGFDSPNNPMLMGNGTDKAFLKIRTSVAPTASAPAVLIGVREEGETTILASHAVVASGDTPLSFENDLLTDSYEVVAGIDIDRSGTLEDTEVCVVFPQKVLAVTQFSYDCAMGELVDPGDLWCVAVGIAKDYLQQFHSAGAGGAQLPGATRDFFLQQPKTTTVSAPLVSLPLEPPTHPLGQEWLASRSDHAGICPLNTFAPDSAFSTLIGSSAQVEGKVLAALATGQAWAQEVWDYFDNQASGPEHVFGPWQWTCSIGTNEWISTFPPHPSVWGSLGAVTISGQISATVRKSDLRLISIRYTGTLYDLYDGSYHKDYANWVIATVEAGYPTLGDGGRIFATRVNFDTTSTSMSYDFSP